MLKEEVRIVKKHGLNHVSFGGSRISNVPWAGNFVALLYDSIMLRSIFPKKFGASFEKHLQFLKRELGGVHESAILEVATGTGNLAEVIPCDNSFFGTDISVALLKRAKGKLAQSCLRFHELYVCPAERLPFTDGFFDIAVCNLSLNFFSDLDKALKESRRVLKRKARFLCSVPVPERNELQTVIRGSLRTELELKRVFESHGFDFSTYDFGNGALLYFNAIAR